MFRITKKIIGKQIEHHREVKAYKADGNKFLVAGTSYYKENIEKLGQPDERFKLSDADLIKRYNHKRVFQYHFDCAEMKVSVKHEPFNKYDHNALRVDINGLKVGYIAIDDQERYKYFAGIHPAITADIYGGYRKIVDDSVSIDGSNYTVKLIVT